MIFELGVKTVLLSVLINIFKALLGITIMGTVFYAIRKVRG
jgi:hypothetical protein